MKADVKQACDNFRKLQSSGQTIRSQISVMDEMFLRSIEAKLAQGNEHYELLLHRHLLPQMMKFRMKPTLS